MGVTIAGGFGAGWRRAAFGVAALLALAGCQGLDRVNPFKADSADAAVPVDASSARLAGGDVEAPEVFQEAGKGLWDGRPSLGGVWVAHPNVAEPERVIIRNTANSKFVIGALFRRERANPGPVFQISSDAAAALDMLAGAPSGLTVTALRREEAAEPDEDAETLAPAAIETSGLEPAPADPPQPLLPAAAPAAQPAAASPAPVAGLDRPYLQIGIFSVEQNAGNAASTIRQAGMKPAVLRQESQGKAFWRVIVGPAATASERAALLERIKGAGFDDAYAVTN